MKGEGVMWMCKYLKNEISLSIILYLFQDLIDLFFSPHTFCGQKVYKNPFFPLFHFGFS